MTRAALLTLALSACDIVDEVAGAPISCCYAADAVQCIAESINVGECARIECPIGSDPPPVCVVPVGVPCVGFDDPVCIEVEQ